MAEYQNYFDKVDATRDFQMLINLEMMAITNPAEMPMNKKWASAFDLCFCVKRWLQLFRSRAKSWNTVVFLNDWTCMLYGKKNSRSWELDS